MWLSKDLVSFFQISLKHVTELKVELEVAKAERDAANRELTSVKVTSDWLRMKVNSLELERSGLMEKAYNIKLPVPELIRTPLNQPDHTPFSFEDLGDILSSKMGLPVFENQPDPRS